MTAMLDEVVKLLNAHGVDFIVIGGWAAAQAGRGWLRWQGRRPWSGLLEFTNP